MAALTLSWISVLNGCRVTDTLGAAGKLRR